MSEYTYISGKTKVVELEGEQAEAMRRDCGIGALTGKLNEILEKYKYQREIGDCECGGEYYKCDTCGDEYRCSHCGLCDEECRTKEEG